jgi:hypothetical protein
MKNKILNWFIEGQTHLACQEVLNRVWPSMNQNRLLFIQIQTVPLNMHHKRKESIDFVCKITNGKLGDQLPMETPIECQH